MIDQIGVNGVYKYLPIAQNANYAMIRPIDVSVDASSFDDYLHLSPASVQILRDVVHNYLLNRFANAYESFPAPEEMEQIDKDLLKFESMLDRSLVRRGVKYYAQFKEQKL